MIFRNGTGLRASHRERVTTVHQRQVRAVNAKFTTLPSTGHGALHFSSLADDDSDDGSLMAAKMYESIVEINSRTNLIFFL